jgi:hypothetical protein
MNITPVLFAMIKADLQERTRRSSFLFALCLVFYLGFAVNTGQILIKLDQYRGVYNSAWVGSLAAVVVTFFLGLFGFYLVKDTIQRDERSGVGQILASTSLTRVDYLLGKWLSNFCVLALLVILLGCAALLMQLIQGENGQVQVWALAAPLLFIALPWMALMAALAVFFESVTWLKGGFGNLVYFAVFIFLLAVGVFLPQYPWLDAVGLNLVGSSMKTAAKAAYPAYTGTFTLSMIASKALDTFTWTGLDWTPGLILQRMLWPVAAMGVVLLAALFFNRFDGGLPLRQGLWRRWFPGRPVEHDPGNAEPVFPPGGAAPHFLKQSLAQPAHFQPNLLRLAWLEFLLLRKGLAWYWFAGLGLFWVGSALVPANTLRSMCFMLCAIWPVLVWSQMGERDARCQTTQLIAHTPNPVLRQQFSAWLAGVGFTALATCGTLLGRWLNAEPLALTAWTLSILFVPSLALCLGSCTKSSKPFEVIYPVLWYLGPLNPQNNLAGLDYLGIHAAAPVHTAPGWMLGVSLALVGLSIIGKMFKWGEK